MAARFFGRFEHSLDVKGRLILPSRYRTQIGDGPVTIYQKGDTFYEPPNGVHQISANASTTEPVRFLAYFLCDSDARLSSPAG